MPDLAPQILVHETVPHWTSLCQRQLLARQAGDAPTEIHQVAVQVHWCPHLDDLLESLALMRHLVVFVGGPRETLVKLRACSPRLGLTCLVWPHGFNADVEWIARELGATSVQYADQGIPVVVRAILRLACPAN